MNRGLIGLMAAGGVAAVAVVALVWVFGTDAGFGPGGQPEPSLTGSLEPGQLDPAGTSDPAATAPDGAAPAPLPTAPATAPNPAGAGKTAADAPTPADGAGEVRARALSKRTQEPLEGATIAFYPAGSEGDGESPAHVSEPSDATGQVVFQDAPTGSWRVVVERPGCSSEDNGTVAVGANVPVDLGEAWLTPSAALTGTVRMGTDAVGGATVSIVDQIALKFGPDMDIFTALKQLKADEVVFAQTHADALGVYTIWWDEVVPGEYVLRGSHSAHASEFASVTLVPSGAPQERDLKLATPASISGRVIDVNGAACPGCRIVLMPEPDPQQFMRDGKMVFFRTQTQTDADGRFAIDSLRPGGYMLWAGGGRYSTVMEQSVRVPTEGHEVQLAPALTLVGQVTDKATGRPIAGAQVGAGGQGGFDVTTTDEDGRYTLQGLSGQNLDVFAKADGYAQVQVNAPGGEGEITFDIQLSGGVRISGRVVQAGTDTPVPNATVIAFPQTGGGGMTGMPSTTTNANGEFTIGGLSLFDGQGGHDPANGSTVGLAVRADGWVHPKTHELQVMPGEQPANVQLQVEAAAVVQGRVLGPDGAPIEGASITARQRAAEGADRNFEMDWMLTMMGGENAITSDAQGRFTLPSVRPGPRTQVLVRHDKYPTGRSADFATRPGGTVGDVEITLAQASTLRVSAVDMSGDPVHGQTLELRRVVDLSGDPAAAMEEMDPGEMMMGGAVRRTQTDPNGEATMTGLGVGSYEIRSDGPLVMLGETKVQITEAGATYRVEVRLQRGLSISGVVRDANGNPVASCWVHATGVGANAPPTANGAQTNARGEFTIEPLAPGEYHLQAWADGQQAFAIPASAGATNVTVVVKPPEPQPAPVPAAGGSGG